ncbi:cadherin-related family member 4 isoform X5 [Onychomys torridus]|uniref:cadherin-related family member 4 isoform X5 n=1 Tax=Onychomys torridus TaxID=38674 RepID=UPI00167FD693|nr:cadherin-related family member 4 isoform X5 [Onychomys torridus]
MMLFRLLAILFALFISVLHSLPWSIDISESQGPGTTLQSFSFNCSSYMPTLELLSVRPPTSFFNNPSLHRHKGVYVGKVTLSSSARLDALAVNRYELQLQYKCGNFVVAGPLFVHVQRDPGRFRCAGPFASPAGEFIYVPETVTPGALLYTLLLPGLGAQRAQMNITSAQDPPLFPGPFSIDEQGLLRAPSQGLRGQAFKTFQLQILVSLGKGQSCKGMLTVKVLPAPSSQVSFPQKAQSITIPEDLVPGSKVIQVQARGFNLLYEIISPLPSQLYSIGQADGVVRTTAPLDLAGAQGAAVTKLQVRAFEKLRPWASAEFDLTVNVRAVNQWPPRCHPALLVTQVPETTPVGTVLSKITCVDPDSAGGPLDFQLQFHNPPDSASLHLRDRVLEVNTTLDCDTLGACFQHAASILVLDDGQPQMTRNSQSRFRLQGTVLMHNDTVLGPPWPEQPCTYELLIHVADVGPSTPHLSTTTTIIVHLVPWRASTVATSTHRSTVSSTMTPLIVTEVEAFWKPEPWFVVVLTATGVVLLLALGWLLSRVLRGFAQLLQAPSKPARALLLNSIPGNEGPVEKLMEAPRMEMSQHFDGRAHDVPNFHRTPIGGQMTRTRSCPISQQEGDAVAGRAP